MEPAAPACRRASRSPAVLTGIACQPLQTGKVLYSAQQERALAAAARPAPFQNAAILCRLHEPPRSLLRGTQEVGAVAAGETPTVGAGSRALCFRVCNSHL